AATPAPLPGDRVLPRRHLPLPGGRVDGPGRLRERAARLPAARGAGRRRGGVAGAAVLVAAVAADPRPDPLDLHRLAHPAGLGRARGDDRDRARARPGLAAGAEPRGGGLEPVLEPGARPPSQPAGGALAVEAHPRDLTGTRRGGLRAAAAGVPGEGLDHPAHAGLLAGADVDEAGAR